MKKITISLFSIFLLSILSYSETIDVHNLGINELENEIREYKPNEFLSEMFVMGIMGINMFSPNGIWLSGKNSYLYEDSPSMLRISELMIIYPILKYTILQNKSRTERRYETLKRNKILKKELKKRGRSSFFNKGFQKYKNNIHTMHIFQIARTETTDLRNYLANKHQYTKISEFYWIGQGININYGIMDNLNLGIETGYYQAERELYNEYIPSIPKTLYELRSIPINLKVTRYITNLFDRFDFMAGINIGQNNIRLIEKINDSVVYNWEDNKLAYGIILQGQFWYDNYYSIGLETSYNYVEPSVTDITNKYGEKVKLDYSRIDFKISANLLF